MSLGREPVEATPRKAMTAARRNRVAERQGVLCARAGCEQRWTEVDHVVPLELGGAEADENLEGLCEAHHKEKTKADVRRIAKARRIRKKVAGENRKTTRKLQGRGFAGKGRGFAGWRTMKGEVRWKNRKS